MKPTLNEIFEGMNYILQNTILPELSSSHANAQALRLSTIIAQTAVFCGATTQFPLIKENEDLKVILLEASTTLKAIKPDYRNKSLGRLIQKIDADLRKKSPSEEEYPSLQPLEEENYNLKELLDNVILSLGQTMQNYKSQSLDDLREKIRAHLRKQLNRQLSTVMAYR